MKKYVKLIVIVFFLGLSASFFFWVSWTAYNNYFKISDEVTVPNLVGMRTTDAEIALKDLKLKLVISETQYNSKFPSQTIISQEPAFGKKVRQGRELSVTVSQGVEMIGVPDIRGMILRDAKITLENKNLQLGKVEKVSNKQGLAEEVLAQQPLAGSQVAKNSAIDVTINSEGSARLDLPSFRGKSLAEVRQSLSQGHFLLGGIDWEWTETYPAGVIIEQKPAAGKTVAAGSTVDLKVSAGSMYSKIPYKQKLFAFNIPPGESIQEVEFILTDDLTSQSLYRANHMPGENVELLVGCWGDGEVEIKVNGRVVRRERM